MLGYDITNQTSVESVIAQVRELYGNGKYDEVTALLSRTLARFPGSTRLSFILARHKYVYAQSKEKAERERMLDEAAELFSYTAEHGDDTRRFWSYYFLVSIYVIKKDYDLALEYNSKLKGFSSIGMYPRVTESMIGILRGRGAEAYHGAVAAMNDCMREYSAMVSWINVYLLGREDSDEVIRESLRAAAVLEKFNDGSAFSDEISTFYESAALAYAKKGDFDACLSSLERAADAAISYDHSASTAPHSQSADIPDDTMGAMPRRFACKSMLDAIGSKERHVYDSVRRSERFENIVKRLTACE